MSQVFGPVPSRRLGRSLGVDPVPFKACNWNCVYCQLGRSAPLRTVRESFFPAGQLVAEVRAAVERLGPSSLDWITFVGSGEPTLHSELGAIIRGVQEFARTPVAVITNGSLLHLEEVRNELRVADAVLPTLDAGSEQVYRRMNRAAPALSFQQHLRGLEEFRAGYPGKLWVEVMLVQGVNDDDRSLLEIAGALARIKPDEVHLNLPSRPTADSRVGFPDEARIRAAKSILGCQEVRREPVVLDLSGQVELKTAILEIVTRHPLEKRQIHEALGIDKTVPLDDAIRELVGEGAVQLVEREGGQFLCAGEGLFG
ncbi:MAG: radical SAM protein [Planctomycetota bacterium]